MCKVVVKTRVALYMKVIDSTHNCVHMTKRECATHMVGVASACAMHVPFKLS